MQQGMNPPPDRPAQVATNSPAIKTRRLILNTGSNYGILVMRIGMTFFLTPVYVKNLGVYDFGVWELVVATLGYAGLLDLGLGFSISRFIATHRAQDDHEALLTVFNTVTAFLSSIGFLLALVTLAIATWYPNVLAGSSRSQQPYSLFLAIIALQVFISFPGIVASGCLDGYQNYYLNTTRSFSSHRRAPLVLYGNTRHISRSLERSRTILCTSEADIYRERLCDLFWASASKDSSRGFRIRFSLAAAFS
jgi:Na+-driven multidrug efflux pump